MQAVAVICTRKTMGATEILVSHRLKGPGYGKIQVIGGHIEEDEQPFETAIREAKEEANVNLHHQRLTWLCTAPHKTEGKSFTVFFYLYDAHGDPNFGTPESLEPEKQGPWFWERYRHTKTELLAPYWEILELHRKLTL